MRIVGVSRLTGWACMVVLAWGCSNDGGASKGDSGTGSGGTASTSTNSAGGTSGASSTSTTTGGPVITSAPAAWERPADCEGIGNRCPNLSGCEEGSICQTQGDVCIPNPGEGQLLPGRSAERPYCAAYTCMTFEEASCFCTGDAVETEPDCTSPSALAGLCGGQGRSCNTSECCPGTVCVQRTYTSQVCEVPCASNDDCESGCCTDLYDTGDMVCAELDACENPCRKRGESCESGETVPNNCCRGACVISENTDWGGCRPRCTTNEDCTETGCCKLFADSDNGFCTDALYCTCGELGARCGEDGTPVCCEGSHCTGQEGAFTCSAECTDDSDCPGSCCREVTGADYMACADPGNCP